MSMTGAMAGVEGPRRSSRIESIDLARGLIMVIMALDHSHDFFGNFAASPTDLSTTTVALFFTRWVTHICAPTFFLLTGMGARLTLGRMSKRELARYLVSRGLWLIFLELVVMRFALQFNLDYRVTIITVLWALGWAMIVLAGLIWLPSWAIGGFGALLIVGHDTLDGIQAASFGPFKPLWLFLHQVGVVFDNGRSLVLVAYVLIPWVGVTALGYVLGATYHGDAARRRRLLSRLGAGMIAAFLILRFVNLYGDPSPWSQQRTPLWTLLSFLDTSKYPPSLLFLLMTLGPALLLLWAFDAGVPRLWRPVLVFGKVPLFFYVLHFYLIHLLAVAVSWLRYHRISETFESPDLAHFPFSAPPGWDLGLPMVYAVWIVVLLSLYPLCRWYAGVRARHHVWWLSYL
ncbi:MAG TPA: heparan-alpha-glucosaminide N-acetyltransferase domain-containing protein [Steroidobacteraceae bacterium]